MKIYNLYISALFLITAVSCVTPDDYSAPQETCTDLTATLPVATLNAATTTVAQQYTADDIMEAYVTSSDEGGNFYKSISFVSLDGTQGFSIPVDQYNLYTEFEPGRKVYVNMKDQYFIRDSNATKIGALYNNGTPANLTDDTVGRLSIVNYKNVLTKSCTKIDEDNIVNNLTIAQALNNSNINKLIEFDMVQFSDASVGQNYYDTDVFTIGGGTNHQLIDAVGGSITVRVSEFATFAANQIPTGNGKVRGVLTKFGSTFQFMIRTLEDVKLDNARLDYDFFPPIVGNGIVYNSTLNEPFTTFGPANLQNFAPYINDAAVGSRYWQLKDFGGNKYIQMSSFGGSAEANRALFIVPVDMTAANTLQFKTKTGFNTGATLKVYYTTDLIPGNQITTATLTNITSNFTIDNGPANGYSTNFLNSGVYSIPAAVTGNGFFVFEYVGNGSTGPTTTMQIDDIVIN